MSKTYRIGFASLVHDHVWGELRHWKAHPNVEIVAAGDVNAELRTQFSNETGVENIYNSWQEMIEKAGIGHRPSISGEQRWSRHR